MKDFADWGGLEPQNLYITNEKQCLYHPFYTQPPYMDLPLPPY